MNLAQGDGAQLMDYKKRSAAQIQSMLRTQRFRLSKAIKSGIIEPAGQSI